MDCKKEMELIFNKLALRHGKYELFSDWVTCEALSISNSTDMINNTTWQRREENYLNIMRKYNTEEIKMLCSLSGLLTMEMQKKPRDILGEIFMEFGCGSKENGQFFTPYHLAQLNAKLTLQGNVGKENKIHLNEPSVGAGGMVIAYAMELASMGINYQKVLEVTAQDLDWKGVYMTYIQLSLLGIKATIYQGNTLEGEPIEKYRCLYTPTKKGMLWM